MKVPFIKYVELNPNATLDVACFPGNLPFIKGLYLDFHSPVTFFVGENGTGKSTLLEALAVLAGLPITGGGTNEIGERHDVQEDNILADTLRMAFSKRPKDGYFFRAELQAHFASLLNQRRIDPDFAGDPYARYGGKSLYAMSHGEAFLSVMQNRFTEGLFILDEPESALSPQRQLALLALMYDLVSDGKSQFIVATHSPILLTYPESAIVSFDHPSLPLVALTNTRHYQITHGILSRPESYWKQLRDSDVEPGGS